MVTEQQLAYLEHYPEQDKAPHRVLIDQEPFRIGRNPAAHFVIYSTKVSKEHAEIYRVGGDYRIRDMGSRNGTFVNGIKIDGRARLTNGDIIHVAHAEFRFSVDTPGMLDGPPTNTTDPVQSVLPSSLIRGGERLREMLSQQDVTTLFQPIVNLESTEVLAYEALGRGKHCELSASPVELFRLADRCRMSAELSRTFRLRAIEQVDLLPSGVHVFFNLHPAEMTDPGLIDSLSEMQAALKGCRRMVVEIHENAVSDATRMRRLYDQLNQADIGLAFDDFGVGQSRFLELAEAPPDYIKLDRSLVHGIDLAEARQELVHAMTRVARKFGVQIIAEGIETSDEARTCEALGCQLGQGFRFGRPVPAGQLAEWCELA
jgi:EAL domain-containing protein (putative c-di-GMP-specific phosphodiesterase class I)